jgi:hypothetical protein
MNCHLATIGHWRMRDAPHGLILLQQLHAGAAATFGRTKEPKQSKPL